MAVALHEHAHCNNYSCWASCCNNGDLEGNFSNAISCYLKSVKTQQRAIVGLLVPNSFKTIATEPVLCKLLPSSDPLCKNASKNLEKKQ